MWDSLSELRSSLCERRLERTVLRPALLPVKSGQCTQFFRQVLRHTVKSLSLTESVQRLLVGLIQKTATVDGAMSSLSKSSSSHHIQASD